MESSTAPRAGVEPRATIAEAFRLTAASAPDQVAVRTKDDEVSLTWAQLRDRVDALAGGLAGLGAAARRHASRSCSATGPSSTSPTSPR